MLDNLVKDATETAYTQQFNRIEVIYSGDELIVPVYVGMINPIGDVVFVANNKIRDYKAIGLSLRSKHE